MSDLESELPGRLTALAERVPITELVEPSIRRGRRRRMQRRSALSVAGIACLVAAIVVPLTLVGSSGPAGSVKVGNTQVQQGAPLSGPGPVDRSFDVASIGFGGDALPPTWGACRLATIRAGAVLRATRYGEAGVVTMLDHRCKLAYGLRVAGLVDASGNLLAVPVASDPDTTNLPESTSAATEYGKAIVGFSWSGSWCGAPATAVRVRMGHSDLDVPLSGPQPGCAGGSDSQLVPGVIGGVGQAVQPPPGAWTGLSTSLAITSDLTNSTLSGMAVTFHNTTSAPIYLSPTPTYTLDYQDSKGDGSSTLGLPVARPNQQLVVPADSTLTVRLPNTRVDVRGTFAPNATITVLILMAGMPSARAQTIVRCAGQDFQGRVACKGPFVN